MISPGFWNDNATPTDPMDDIWVDGDYRLQSNSPCIDAGTSDNAPVKDIEGNSRYDVPTVPNTGSGLYPYYDMGVYEYQGGVIDSDSDGVLDNEDNCPNKPNGLYLGTCSSTSDKPGYNCTT